jgi:O-antigen/teichoic acid export membrane protein
VSFTRLKHYLGIDRAIGVTSATQLMRFVTGPITMLLIIKYLTPTDQGFYYAFAGVAGIQVFLEAGFAVSIAQFTAKEFAGLRFTKSGFLTGKSENLSRLRSIYQKAFRYYSAMAAVLTLGIGIGGYVFFSSRPSEGVHWQIPWIVAAVCMGFQFLLTPFWAVLEGCNRVADVATYYFWMTLIGFTASALGFVITQSLDVVIFTSVVSLLTSYVYIFSKWLKLRSQVIRPFRKHQQVAWFKDVWGFQWRIAGTWTGRYFLEAGIPAIAFQFFGPIVAGQAGMSFQLSKMAGSIASSWTVTKIPFWGQLVAQDKRRELDTSWRSAGRMHLIVSFIGQASVLIALMIFAHFLPQYADRVFTPLTFAGLSIGWFLYSFWLISMHYVRAHRLEPFVWAHWLLAVSFLFLLAIGKGTFGPAALTYSFAIVHVPVALWSLMVMKKIQRQTAQLATAQ